MNRTEIQHNTRQQVLEGARDAVAIADELGPADVDRAALLPTIMNQVTSKTINFDAPVPMAVPMMAIPRENGRR